MRDERIYLNKSTLKPLKNVPFLFRISNTKENMFLLQRGLRTYPREKKQITCQDFHGEAMFKLSDLSIILRNIISIFISRVKKTDIVSLVMCYLH